MVDVQSEIMNKHLAINISEALDISKVNIGSVCVPNANGSQSNDDLQTLMNIVPFLVPILFSIIICMGFFGNLLVVCVVTQNKKMRNTTNLLILNLAVSFNKHVHLFESNLNLKLIIFKVCKITDYGLSYSYIFLLLVRVLTLKMKI